MNINQVKYSLALAESLSFTQAAKVCGVTQPTLSNGVSHLEKEFGKALFERSSQQVTITSFGNYALPFMKAILETYSNLAERVENF